MEVGPSWLTDCSEGDRVTGLLFVPRAETTSHEHWVGPSGTCSLSLEPELAHSTQVSQM